MIYDEKIVVEGLRKGDNKAYAAMVKRFEPSMTLLVSNFIYDRQEMSDMVNHIFEEALLKIEYYTPTHKFSTWLFTIGKNNCIDYCRTRKRRPDNVSMPKDVDVFIAGDGDCPENQFIRNQQREAVERAINSLRDKPKLYVTEYYLNQLKYEEISNKYNEKETTIRACVHRAREKLKKKLIKYR